MPTCRQIVELFLSDQQWKEAKIHEQNEEELVKLIKSDSEGDFDVELGKEEVTLSFGFLNVKIPRDKFLLEIGRTLMDEVCGEDVVSWAIQQDRKKRSSGGKNNGS